MFDFKRMKVSAAAALLLLFAAVAAGEEFKGKVVTTVDDKLVVSVGEEQADFHINDETMITLDGEEARLSALLAGHTVTVNAERDGDRWIAKMIMAMSAF